MSCEGALGALAPAGALRRSSTIVVSFVSEPFIAKDWDGGPRLWCRLYGPLFTGATSSRSSYDGSWLRRFGLRQVLFDRLRAETDLASDAHRSQFASTSQAVDGDLRDSQGPGYFF